MTPGHRRYLLSTVSLKVLTFMRPMHPMRATFIARAAESAMLKEQDRHRGNPVQQVQPTVGRG